MDELMNIWEDVAPIVTGLGIVYIVAMVIVLVIVVSIFVLVFKTMRDMNKRFDEDWRK